MNSLERVVSAIKGGESDRPAFALLLSLIGSRFVDCSMEEFYRNPNIWFKGQKAAIEKFDTDIVTTAFAFPLEAEVYGSTIEFPYKYAPNVKKPVYSDVSEFSGFKVADFTHKNIQFILEITKLMVNEYAGNKAIASLLFSPSDLPALLFGIEKWIDIMMFQAERIEEILKKTSEHFVKIANACLELGANFIVTTSNFTNPTIVTETMFKAVLPHLRDAFSKINGPIVIHHGGCKIGRFIKEYSELPNVIGAIIDTKDSLEESRKLSKEGFVILGNIDGPMLENYSIKTARQKCMDILENRRGDSNFIFASSNADIAYNTSFEIIEEITETIKKFKRV